jgi:hypothetical protein
VRAGEGLTKATNADELADLAWDFVREQLHVGVFFVGLYDAHLDTLRFPLAYADGQAASVRSRRLGDEPANWGIAGHVVKTGESLIWASLNEGKQRCQKLA